MAADPPHDGERDGRRSGRHRLRLDTRRSGRHRLRLDARRSGRHRLRPDGVRTRVRAQTITARRSALRRRLTYLMLFRLVLISLVLGATLLLSWFTDIDVWAPSSLLLFALIIATYALTIVYALALDRVDMVQLSYIQLTGDLVISSLLIHFTGGAQSAYSFFFALEIIAAATIFFRVGAVVVAGASIALFVGVSALGWLEALPVAAGQQILPADQTAIELGRSLALNVAAFLGVAVLAYNLGGQIQATSASLETERTAAADLFAQHEDIVRCLDSGLVTIDRDGRVFTINQAACAILGLEADGAQDRARGVAIDALIPGLGELLDELPPRGSLPRTDVIASDGEVSCTLGVSVSPLRNNRDDIVGRIVVLQDLTELRQMEAQMRRAERLAVVGTLAAGVAHEIRNPLAAISGSIELLHADPRTDEDSRALMGIVTREVDRLNALLTDLLDYANPSPPSPVAFDLAQLVDETLQVFKQDRGFEDVTVTAAPDSARAGLALHADPSRVRQVLWNLLRNGAEAARQGGGTVVVLARRDGPWAEIEIRDDGPGIAIEDAERVFDPFFTTKSRGSGLGLATCHSIVTELGGEIALDSEPGRGCRFIVCLPLTAASQPPVTPIDAREPPATPIDAREPPATPIDAHEPPATPAESSEPSATPADSREPNAANAADAANAATPADAERPAPDVS